MVLIISMGGNTSKSECDTWEGAYDTYDNACDIPRCIHHFVTLGTLETLRM